MSLAVIEPVVWPHDELNVVLGVDTHCDQHTAAVVSSSGVLHGCRSFAATASGYPGVGGLGLRSRDASACGPEGHRLVRDGVVQALQSQGMVVLEVNQPDKRARRAGGKTDEIDAEAAARAVLHGRARALAKSADGPVEELRQLKVVRDSAVQAGTKAVNQLKSVIVTADPTLREGLTGLGTKTLVRRCRQLDGPGQPGI